MNPINKKALELTNTTQEDFLEFCKISKMPKTSSSTRSKYFYKILCNKVIRDKSGNIKIVK